MLRVLLLLLLLLLLLPKSGELQLWDAESDLLYALPLRCVTLEKFV
jgi:hypothetical protein